MLTAQTSSKVLYFVGGLCAIGFGFLVLAGQTQGQEAELTAEPTAEETVDPGTELTVTNSSPQEQTITVIPPRVGDDKSLTVKPGEQIVENIQVQNNSEQSVTIVTSAADFMVGDDGTTPVAITDANPSEKWSLANWMVMTPTTQTLAPNELGQVNVIINVPEDALPGGHYAMVTHEPAGANGEVQGSAINQKTGTLFYVIVDGDINEEAFVRDFSFPEMSEYGPVPFTFSVENQSDVHITPRIKVDIKNMMGQTVDTIVPEEKNIFPLSSRDYAEKWDVLWGFGLYTANLTMSYGAGGQTVVESVSFWVLPVKVLLAVLVVILVLVASFISIRRHMMHRNSDEQQKIKMLEEQLKEAEADKKE